MPHFFITFVILLMATLIMVVNYLFSLCGWSSTVHVIVVMVVDAVVVWGTYMILHFIERKHPDTFLRMKAVVKQRMAGPSRIYLKFQGFIDHRLMNRRRK